MMNISAVNNVNGNDFVKNSFNEFFVFPNNFDDHNKECRIECKKQK